MGLTAPSIRAKPFRQVNARAIPPSGRSPEAIWHLAYDTQTYTDNTTTLLNFFNATNVGNRFLSNMELPGQFPAPQVFEVYGIYFDAWTAVGISTSATNTGNGNDLQLLMAVGRPVWTFTLQQKNYGPYPLVALHGLGGPSIFGFSNDGAEILQFAKNDCTPGFGYQGSITIPAQTAFQFKIEWTAAQDLTADWLLRVTLGGILSRAVK